MPYHVVPPSGLKNVQISIAFAAVVLESDPEPPGYLNVPPVYANVTVLLGVASFVNMTVAAAAPEAFEKVSVALPVNVTLKTVPVVKSNVAAVPEFTAAGAVSAILVVVIVGMFDMLRESSITVVPATLIAIFAPF